jgi:hypothetical protein
LNKSNENALMHIVKDLFQFVGNRSPIDNGSCQIGTSLFSSFKTDAKINATHFLEKHFFLHFK